MRREVTDDVASIHRNYGKCGSFAAFPQPHHHHEIAISASGKAVIDGGVKG